jgi:polysaccharide export outer membrane protein
MILFKIIRLNLLIFSLITIYSCALSPGINENPTQPEFSENIQTQNIDVKINDLSTLTFNDIELINDDYVNEETYDVTADYYGLYDYVYEYQLGPGDEVVINLTETDDIDGNYLIDPFGMIDLPYVGKINIKDLTSSEAQNILFNVLKKFYKNPDLQIDIVEFNSSKVYVTGTVRNQLVIDMDDKPLRVLDALIRANVNTTGNDNLASTSGIIRRDGRVFEIDLIDAIRGSDEKQNFYLKKNDVIFIDRNPNSILVFGEVTQSGSYFPYAGYSLTQLVSDSGLNQLTADAKNVFVIRENLEEDLKIDVFKMNLKNPVNLVAGRKFLLQNRDIVYIPPTDLVKWNRVISLLIPQTNLFKSYNPIIQRGVSANSINVQ